MADMVDRAQRPDWRERPLILAAIGAVAALIVWWLTDIDGISSGNTPVPYCRLAAGAGVAAAAMAFGFTVERLRLNWAIIFAVAAGVVSGLILYLNGDSDSRTGIWFGGWGSLSLFVAIAIAAPLFQTARDEGAARWPYADVHTHAWTNVVLWFACWLFVVIAMGLAYLLAALFGLVGIEFLQKLLREGWFWALLVGTAFGGALGLFRERDRVVRLLQAVVTTVASVLAPVLAAGLALFLIALPFTGLGALWDATRATTPILLSCVIGALILSNAVIGNGEPDEEPRNPVLRWSALALAVVILPLAIIAAIATGLRISQYGLTPDRLWAVTFVAIAVVYGLKYLWAVARRRQDWADSARPANLRLGFALGALALFLATPLAGFNWLSTRDQLARLENGRVTPDKFDWAALRFDFGAPGRAAVERLVKSSRPAIRVAAVTALKADSRWDLSREPEAENRADRMVRGLRISPNPVPLPDGLRAQLGYSAGDPDKRPILFYAPGDKSAILVTLGCNNCKPVVTRLAQRRNGRWFTNYSMGGEPELSPAERERVAKITADGIIAGQVEIRSVQRRQVFVAGHPVGEVFE